MEKLKENVIQNIAINHNCRYRCEDLRNEFVDIVRRHNGKKYFIFLRLTKHFGRIKSQTIGGFVGELGSETSWTLLDDVNKNCFIKVKDRKKYDEYVEVYTTFVCYRKKK